jgi:hypothetical protein
MNAPLVRRKIGNILTLKINAPGVGFFEPSEHTQKRGLPASARAEQRKELTLFYSKRHIINSGHRAETFRHVIEDEKVIIQFLAPPLGNIGE